MSFIIHVFHFNPVVLCPLNEASQSQMQPQLVDIGEVFFTYIVGHHWKH